MNAEREATRVIESFLTGRRTTERAAGIAESLRQYGRLAGGIPVEGSRERVVNDLGCVMDQPVAERVAAALDEAGLLSASTEVAR